MVLNIIVGEGHIGRFSASIRRWFTPMRANLGNEESPNDNPVSR
jgi:hypothetical protein